MPLYGKAVFTWCYQPVYQAGLPSKVANLATAAHIAEIYSFLSLAESVEFRISIRQSSFCDQLSDGATDANVIANVFERVFAQPVQQGQRGNLGDVLRGGVGTAV